MNTIRTILLSTLLLVCMKIQAQQNTVSTGGDNSGAGGSMSYSIGQIDYSTSTGSGGNLSEGVQQPYTITITTGIQNTNIDLKFSVYPNPTTDIAVLSIKNSNTNGMSYQLIDLNGKLISEKNISDNKSIISMKELNVAIYFIKILQNNNELKTFKIIKN